MLQRYSATASCEPSSDLLKISARSHTNENHALQAPFDQFSAPAVHLPFLASIPDVPMLAGLLACWVEPQPRRCVLEVSLALQRCSATAGCLRHLERCSAVVLQQAPKLA